MSTAEYSLYSSIVGNFVHSLVEYVFGLKLFSKKEFTKNRRIRHACSYFLSRGFNITLLKALGKRSELRTLYGNCCFFGEALEAGFKQLGWNRVKNTSGWLHPANCNTDCIFCHHIIEWHSKWRFMNREIRWSTSTLALLAHIWWALFHLETFLTACYIKFFLCQFSVELAFCKTTNSFWEPLFIIQIYKVVNWVCVRWRFIHHSCSSIPFKGRVIWCKKKWHQNTNTQTQNAQRVQTAVL